MKKKILFIMPSMFIGGAERSLLGLLEAIDYDKTEVSLFLYRHEGEFLRRIPDQVKLLSEIPQYRTFDVPIKSLLFCRRALFGIARIMSKAALKMHCMRTGERRGTWMAMQYTSRFLQPLLPDIPGEYDIAIMFLGVGDTLINKVRAKQKLTWCHTDYDTLGPDKRMDLKTYARIDYLVAVSDECASKIRSTYPEIEDKVIVIENVLAEQLIRQQAEEFPAAEEIAAHGIRLLSIGRYCEAKNFDNIPDICARLLRAGLDVHWYIIGFGGDEALIRKKIEEAGMGERVILLGKKDNPYPYLRTCDLYVQPSRYEGKCVAVREAQMLGKPVVITRYATSASQLEEDVDGVIVPMDNEGCAEGIRKLLLDREKMERITGVCRMRDYSNSVEARKLDSLSL